MVYNGFWKLHGSYEGSTMKKKLIILAAIVAAFIIILGIVVIYRHNVENQSGILLSFDDYNEKNWEDHFDLFDKYNVKVTFFINAGEPTDFCTKAISRGHEIGYHTKGHARLTEVSDEEFIEQAIAPIAVFKEKGIELTSFAYPYGAYTEETNEKLLQHYKITRGAYFYHLHQKITYQKGFVESKPIDNVYYETDELFEEDITNMLTEVKENKRTIVSMYSHSIDGGDWCVTEDRLEFIFKKAQELGLKFYIYKDLQ